MLSVSWWGPCEHSKFKYVDMKDIIFEFQGRGKLDKSEKRPKKDFKNGHNQMEATEICLQRRKQHRRRK